MDLLAALVTIWAVMPPMGVNVKLPVPVREEYLMMENWPTDSRQPDRGGDGQDPVGGEVCARAAGPRAQGGDPEPGLQEQDAADLKEGLVRDHPHRSEERRVGK